VDEGAGRRKTAYLSLMELEMLLRVAGTKQLSHQIKGENIIVKL
jgi:tRNA threonylcarbamoyladenosine modification (KEOPS) complex Cgi121 subunit